MGKKILILDDHVATVQAIQKVLATKGYQVVGQTDPAKALEELDAETGLVLLDIGMPGMDGIEFCRRLRKIPHGAKVPVVILSGKDPKDVPEWDTLGMGVRTFLRKPVKLAQLLEVIVQEFGMSDREVSALLKEFHIRKPPPPPPPPPPAEEPPPEPPAKGPPGQKRK